MFGGNIERNSNNDSVISKENTDQVHVSKCYRFEIYVQYYVNHNPTSKMTLVYDQKGFYTEAEFQIKSDELYETYTSTVGPNGNGTGVLYLHSHNLAPFGSCSLAL